jgi:hypothetical protein
VVSTTWVRREAVSSASFVEMTLDFLGITAYVGEYIALINGLIPVRIINCGRQHKAVFLGTDRDRRPDQACIQNLGLNKSHLAIHNFDDIVPVRI